MMFQGPHRAPLRIAVADGDEEALAAFRAQTLFDAEWTRCSDGWLEEHPGECGTAFRVRDALNPNVHWHPRQTRKQILREAARAQRAWIEDPANRAVIEERGLQALPDVIDPDSA
ncbi:hypothetical protein ACFZAM_31975 [Streptomyces sp. NPDC008079]|uniref:hypothetical protein n=1 Tax=Streptomyces sp. NPDC008079 TaxID=3364806 RepID=UPI0036EF9481